MAKQVINVGTSANDKSGDPLRSAFQKVNSNFTELYNAMLADVQIPLQTGNNGKYLTTDGVALSWATVGGGGAPDFFNLGNSNLTPHPTQIQIGNNLTGYEVGDEGSGIFRIDATGADTGVVRFASNVIYTAQGQVLFISPSDDGHNQIIIPSTGEGVDFPLTLTNSDGNVVIQTGSSANQWTFDDAGILNLPQNTDVGAAVIQPNDTTFGIKVISNGHTWAFGTDGYLTGESLQLNGFLKGVDGSTGTTGQVLTRQSNGGVAWADASGGGGGVGATDVSVHGVTLISTSGTTNLAGTVDIVLVDVNAAGGDIFIFMPASPTNGKCVTVKNINHGANNLYVQPGNPNSIETESGTVGSGFYATMNTTGAVITWVFYNGTWRIINQHGL